MFVSVAWRLCFGSEFFKLGLELHSINAFNARRRRVIRLRISTTEASRSDEGAVGSNQGGAPPLAAGDYAADVDGANRRFLFRTLQLVVVSSGKTSQKHQSCSIAYIDFKRPEDVLEFAEFFNGHVFVNEKGAQFKTIVEYAPSQRVPKKWSKKDGREGTIFKDPEYVEFLEVIAKPVENLPSAEIQLERREAERTGAVKDNPIVTPLMDFVRQKRAAKAGPRRLLKRLTTMYVLRDSAKNTSGKDKSTYILIPKRDDQQIVDKPVASVSATGSEVLEEESGVSGYTDAGKKKVLLLKGKERETSHVSSNISQQQNAASSVNTYLSEQQGQNSNLEKDKQPPRPPHVQLVLKDANGVSDDKVGANELHSSCSEKLERRTRNKDRPDRGVWTLRRSDGSYASDESLSSKSSQPSLSAVDSSEGSYRHGGRRGPTNGVKDADGTFVISEGKPLRRGGASGYGSHEKQVWVQKSSSGS
ncbi:hypothetical protein LWI29_016027 [Acer saccharum]|uniref:UPF3 domain-containing protein n=1 Tax=Acer saccharum TaxID=4024 RepID=A0AA39S8S5_ACESA|nr:hypothetical protein LWI29_016027 [Acer saccharum]